MNAIEKFVAGAAAALVSVTLLYGVATMFSPDADDAVPAAELISHNGAASSTQN